MSPPSDYLTGIDWIQQKIETRADVRSNANGRAFNAAEEREEEYFIEQEQLRCAVVGRLKEKHPEVDRRARAFERRAHSKKSDSQAAAEIRLQKPYTLQQVQELMIAFCCDKPPVLNRDDLEALVTDFRASYAKQWPTPVARMTIPEDAHLVVVGDTHGQLNDVLWILCSQGLPGPDSYYIFNGDVADRGPNAVPIFVLLFLLHILYPKQVLVNRGNHEDVHINHLPAANGGGFFDYVKAMYDVEMYGNFAEVFLCLPLLTIVNDDVVVVHGGLPKPLEEPLTPAYINSLPWKEFTSPPADREDDPCHVFGSLLWSDPREEPGWIHSHRGSGTIFGPDVTADFLRSNRFKMCVRSHQCPEDNHGFSVHHEGLCLTIFSASNYGGESGNWGAVLCFDGATWPQYRILEHWAPSLKDISPLVNKRMSGAYAHKKMDAGDLKQLENRSFERKVTQTLEEGDTLSPKVLRKLLVQVVQNKPELFAAFQANDPTMSTKVPLATALEILSSICGANPAWENALKNWKALEDEDTVLDYDEFLFRFRVELADRFAKDWKFVAVQDAFANLVSRADKVADLFSVIDKDGDGQVSKEEFISVMEEAGLELSKTQLDSLMKHCGMSKGVVATHEFLSRFTLTFKHDIGIKGHEAKDSWAALALERLGRHLLTLSLKADAGANGVQKVLADYLYSTFNAFDTNGDGILTTDEFVEGLGKLPGVESVLVEGKPLDKEGMARICKYVDFTGDGEINYLEFIKAFGFEDSSGVEIQDSIVDEITTTLFRNAPVLMAGCQFFDYDLRGRVKTKDFCTVLQAVSSVLKKPQMPFTETQITRLSSSLEDGEKVMYADFVEAFQVYDSNVAEGKTADCLVHQTSLAEEVQRKSLRPSMVGSPAAEAVAKKAGGGVSMATILGAFLVAILALVLVLK